MPLDPDRGFVPGDDQSEMSALPLETHRPFGAGDALRFAVMPRGERARKGGVPTAYGACMARKKRAPPISYRPPVSMRDEFAARVRNSGLSVSGFITRAVFAGEAPRARPQPRLDRATAATLLAQAAAIADQLAAMPDGTPERDETLRACREELLLIRTFLMQLTGREP